MFFAFCRPFVFLFQPVSWLEYISHSPMTSHIKMAFLPPGLQPPTVGHFAHDEHSFNTAECQVPRKLGVFFEKLDAEQNGCILYACKT